MAESSSNTYFYVLDLAQGPPSPKLPVSQTASSIGSGLQAIRERNGNPISRYMEQLNSLCDLSSSMNIAVPSGEALKATKDMLAKLNSIGLIPARLSPAAEGGVAIAFRNGENFADIEILNTREISALTSNSHGKIEVWNVFPVSVDDTLKRIRVFIGL